MTQDPEREARQRAVEWALQHGEVELDSPAETCAKIGHRWHEVSHDSDTVPAYSRTCRRCGAAEISAPGHDWRPV